MPILYMVREILIIKIKPDKEKEALQKINEYLSFKKRHTGCVRATLEIPVLIPKKVKKGKIYLLYSEYSSMEEYHRVAQDVKNKFGFLFYFKDLLLGKPIYGVFSPEE